MAAPFTQAPLLTQGTGEEIQVPRSGIAGSNSEHILRSGSYYQISLPISSIRYSPASRVAEGLSPVTGPGGSATLLGMASSKRMRFELYGSRSKQISSDFNMGAIDVF